MAGVRPSKGARTTALVGVLSACSLAFLWFASLTPTGRLGLTAVAGLFPVGVVLASDPKTGFLCCAVSGILGMILVPDKGIALMYLIFFGLYPVLKSLFEKQSHIQSWLFKLLYFNLVLALFWFLLRSLFLPQIPEQLDNNAIIFLLGNVIFVLYDIGLSRLIFGFLRRLPQGRRNR